jgi:hypothetical protein
LVLGLGAIVLALSFLGLPGAAAASANEPPSLQRLLEVYEQVRLSLLADQLAPVATAAQSLDQLLTELERNPSAAALGAKKGQEAEVIGLLPEMRLASKDLMVADSLATARDAFYALSKPLVRWLHHVDDPALGRVAYCPMEKRSWVQPEGEIGNPYGGQAMPTCGTPVSR